MSTLQDPWPSLPAPWNPAPGDSCRVTPAARVETGMWKEWNNGRELNTDTDKVHVNPGCGFGWRPAGMAVDRLRAIVAGMRMVCG